MNSTISVVGVRAPAAKKADASFRISFARRSSRFSERSFRISADSTLVVPGRAPAPTSAFLTQLWTFCADPIPRFEATDSLNGRPLRSMLRPDLIDQPYSALARLLRVAPRASRHDPVLPKRRSLRQIRGGSGLAVPHPSKPDQVVYEPQSHRATTRDLKCHRCRRNRPFLSNDQGAGGSGQGRMQVNAPVTTIG
jgi:hypothetical protein